MSQNDSSDQWPEKPWWEGNTDSSAQESNFVPIDKKSQWRDEQAPDTRSMPLLPATEEAEYEEDTDAGFAKEKLMQSELICVISATRSNSL